MEEKQVVCLIDGDLIAYKCAAAAEKRKVLITHKNSGKSKEYKTRTEFKKFLEGKGIEFNKDDYEFEDKQYPENFIAVQKSMQAILNKIRNNTFADKLEIYLGGGDNFRHELHLPLAYKRNRSDMLRPVLLDQARQYLIDSHKAVLVEGEETDDVVTWRAYEVLEEGGFPIIVTADKDANQSSNCGVLDWTKDELEVITIDPVGHIDKIAITSGKTTRYDYKGTGLKFLAYQVLVGDNADTYCGYDLSKNRYGAAKGYNALVDCTTEKEIIETLISEYKKLYPEPITYTDVHGKEHTKNYLEILRMYWKCACMKRTKDDDLLFDDFINKLGVRLGGD